MSVSYFGSIDWAATGSMLSGWATLIGAGAVVYAAHKGSDTFKQWRRQKSEERRIDLAEQVLTLAYKLRRSIESIRSPMMLAGEIADVEAKLREQGLLDDHTAEGKKGNLTTAQATLYRVTSYKELWDALLDIMPVAKAVFGDEIEAQLNAFWLLRGKIVAAAQSYARLPDHDHARNAEARQREIDRRERLEQAIWFGGGEDGVDALANSVDEAVKSLEVHLLPIIRSDTQLGVQTIGSRK